MGGLVMIATWLVLLISVSSAAMSSEGESSNMLEVMRCLKSLQESGKRIFVSYVSGTMRLFDGDGDEVSCDAGVQKRLRQKSDRRCIFSPIHCLFNKRIQSAKILSQWQQSKGFAVRR